MNILFTLLFLVSPAHAQKMPVLTDTTITTSAEILNRIQEDSMAALKTKYSDLQKNYTPHFLTTGLDLDCRSGSAVASENQTFAGIRVANDVKQLADGRIQTFTTVSHFNCSSQLIFSERIRVVGKSAKPLDIREAVKFVRLFEVEADSDYRTYQIENNYGEILFSIHSQRTTQNSGSRIYTSLDFSGAKWLELDQIDPNPNLRRLYITVNPGSYSGRGFQSRITFGKDGPYISHVIWTDRTIEHFVDGTLTSQANFDSTISSLVLGITVEALLKSIFASFISQLPETKKIEVGVSDSPFLRELQLNYNRMLTNTEQAQVKLFFQKTIDDIKAGRIKVE